VRYLFDNNISFRFAQMLAAWPLIKQFASSALPATCGVIQQRGRIRLL
jgi:hypothetical protein